MFRRQLAIIAGLALIACGDNKEPGARSGLTRAETPGHVETAYLAGGCYWGVEAVFEHVRGVNSVVAGFAVGSKDSVPGVWHRPNHSGYAEAVEIQFDPAQISYGELLEILLTVAADPTQLDRQGPDTGPQYRSAVFATDSSQLQEAATYIDELRKSAKPGRPVVTELELFHRFHPALEPQQDFAAKHPTLPYIVINDHPKIEQLKARYPALYEG